MDQTKTEILNTISQTLPDLEAHIEEITKSLESLAIEVSALSNSQHISPGEDDTLQISGRRESSWEKDRLALEAEKKAMERSQQICAAAGKEMEDTFPKLKSPSFYATISGANYSGLQIGQSTGTINWGARP